MSAGEHTGEHAGELRSSPSELQWFATEATTAWVGYCMGEAGDENGRRGLGPVTKAAGEDGRRSKTGRAGEGGGDEGETRAAGETGFLFPSPLTRGRGRSDLDKDPTDRDGPI